MPDPVLLITCEHAVNHVPARWADLFDTHRDILESHRGWDPGAQDLADALAATFSVPCVAAEVSRLLVDHNRSPHNRLLWSEFSRPLPEDEKATILNHYYHPFRDRVGDWISTRVDSGVRVIHLAVHSFTPVFAGRVRNVDIGILYDPGRSGEVRFADLWKAGLSRTRPEWRVRFNAPYRGRSDCHQSTYRKSYPCWQYVGIELEVNQALMADSQVWKRAKNVLSRSLKKGLSASGSNE